MEGERNFVRGKKEKRRLKKGKDARDAIECRESV